MFTQIKILEEDIVGILPSGTYIKEDDKGDDIWVINQDGLDILNKNKVDYELLSEYIVNGKREPFSIDNIITEIFEHLKEISVIGTPSEEIVLHTINANLGKNNLEFLKNFSNSDSNPIEEIVKLVNKKFKPIYKSEEAFKILNLDKSRKYDIDYVSNLLYQEGYKFVNR